MIAVLVKIVDHSKAVRNEFGCNSCSLFYNLAQTYKRFGRLTDENHRFKRLHWLRALLFKGESLKT